VSDGQGKRRDGQRVSIRVSVVIRHKNWPEIRLFFGRPRQRCTSCRRVLLYCTVDSRQFSNSSAPSMVL